MSTPLPLRKFGFYISIYKVAIQDFPRSQKKTGNTVVWKTYYVSIFTFLCSISPLFRWITSVTPLSPAVAQKNISHPPCQSTAGFTLAPSRRPLGDLWAASRLASHQRDSSHKASWWSWWARDWWTPCARRPTLEGPPKAFCLWATTCVLSWSSWLWPPRRQRCTSQIGKLCKRLRSLQWNWPKEHSTFGNHLTSEHSHIKHIDLFVQQDVGVFIIRFLFH